MGLVHDSHLIRRFLVNACSNESRPVSAAVWPGCRRAEARKFWWLCSLDCKRASIGCHLAEQKLGLVASRAASQHTACFITLACSTQGPGLEHPVCSEGSFLSLF